MDHGRQPWYPFTTTVREEFNSAIFISLNAYLLKYTLRQ